MKKWYFYITHVLFGFWSCIAYSQTYCTVPLPPVLTLVSIQPESGKTELSWILSPSSDVAAYIIYSYKNGDATPIDTLWNPIVTSYNYISTAYKYFSVSFVVAAYRLPGTPGISRRFGCPSELSNVISTMFANSEIDTCNKKITISWNNYSIFPKKVTGYSLLVSVNGDTFTEAATTGIDKNNFTLSDFIINADYCFVVRANLEDGTFSTSNKACLSTKMQRPPVWINADKATVSQDKKISLSFTIDPLSQITHFRLERKTGQSGVYQDIANPVSDNGLVTYSDDRADVNLINYYRLSAINNCNNPVTVSNTASNIVLSLTRSVNDLNFSWNSYKNWLGIISSYHLFINSGNGFEEKAIIQATDTVFKIGYNEIMYEVSESEVCFYISALEISNPYGISGQSLSSVVCISPTEIITAPNIFTPKSGTKNAWFKPVLSFTPKYYHLIISDMHGKMLFETKDYLEEWDGTQNGEAQPQGVCLWFLKVTTPSGKSISKTGTITIINNR